MGKSGEGRIMKIKKSSEIGHPTEWCSVDRIGEDWGYCQNFFVATFTDGYKYLFEVDRVYLKLILSEDQRSDANLFSEEEWQSTLESILFYYKSFCVEERNEKRKG